VVRPRGSGAQARFAAHGGEFLFGFVLSGELALNAGAHGDHRLREGDSCVIPADAPYALNAAAGAEMLEVTLPAELPQR
jgi:quercetin dioxygenase-like cupin family protein